MKDGDLNKLLRTVKVPERSAEERAEFPQEVVRQLSRPGHQQQEGAGNRWSLPLWALGFATVCLVIGFIVGRMPEKSPALQSAVPKMNAVEYAKLFKEVATLFPDRLRGVVVRNGEMELILADQPERAMTTPLLVEFCQNGRCRTVITFSGQKLDIDGHTIEVLTGTNDRVIVLADNQVWTSQTPTEVVDGFRIQAQVL